MSLKDVQKEVDNWISQYKIGYFKPHEILARLSEEVGETAREVNHLFGSKKKKDFEDTRGLQGELGDIIFTVCCMANSLGIDLDEAFKMIMDKCYNRDKDNMGEKIINLLLGKFK